MEHLAEALERGLALLLLLCAAPLIGALWLLVRWTSGGPSFYRGVRLGRGQQPFTIYKVRTLAEGAQHQLGGELVGQRTDLLLPHGRFLRETRLDELPQLFNIVRGDMSFVGPRPERPEVFAEKCRGIPGYEQRFLVQPGLVGVSQLFTPHGTSKRYRTLLDNGTLRGGHSAWFRLWLVVFTAAAVLRVALRRALRMVGRRLTRLRRLREMRRLRRVAPGGAVAYVGRLDSAAHRLRVVDMNEECLLLEGQADLKDGELWLDIPVRGAHRPGRRTARCRGRVTHQRHLPDGAQLVFRYEPSTPRSEYMIHQYFLGGSLAVPRRGREPLPAGAGRQRGRARGADALSSG